MGPGNRQFKGLKSIVTKGILTAGLLNILFLASAQDPTASTVNSHPIPIIHTSDLFHPPYDPDDQVDLGCLYALPELDVLAIIIDYHRDNSDLHMYEPAFGMITQLNWMTGKAVPAAVGPNTKLRTPEDDGEHFSLRNQAGIKLLIDKLKSVNEPVYISIVGSSRTVAAAFNREPELFRKKVRAILLVAGYDIREKGDKLDTNSNFDPNAFVAIMRSGLPIRWFPPGAWGKMLGGADIYDLDAVAKVRAPHAAKFIVPHTTLFDQLPKMVHAWLMYGFTGNQRGDIIRTLHEEWYAGMWWGVVKGGLRPLSSIPAIVMAAERKLVRTDEGWRFVPQDSVPEGAECLKLDFIPVEVQVDDDAHTSWKIVKESNILLFDREPDQGLYNKAMGEGVNGLLRDIPLEDSSQKFN